MTWLGIAQRGGAGRLGRVVAAEVGEGFVQGRICGRWRHYRGDAGCDVLIVVVR